MRRTDPIRLSPPLSRRILHRIAILALSLYWAALFMGTHTPRPGVAIGQYNDKLLHFGAYAGLAFLIAAVLTAFRLRVNTLLLSWATAAGYGVVDELSQLFISNRSAEVGDWLADSSGALVGLGVFALVVVSAKRALAPWYDVTRWTSCP